MLQKCFIFISILSLVYAARISEPDERIVGGHYIPIENVPWQVSVLLNNKHHCGGSILSKRTVLTAAHCVKGRMNTELSVRAGSSHWKKDGQLVRIIKSIWHKNYNESTLENDVAVLFLESALEFNDSVQKIDLATESPKTGIISLATGWGRTFENSTFSWPILHGVHLTIFDHHKCQKAYATMKLKVTEGMICAFTQEKDTCQGDSGGPLVSVKNWQLIGIVSFGIGCANISYPGVYTNVTYYEDWIINTINNNNCIKCGI